MDDGQGAVALREPPEREHDQRGPAQEPGDGRRGPHTPSEALAHHNKVTGRVSPWPTLLAVSSWPVIANPGTAWHPIIGS